MRALVSKPAFGLFLDPGLGKTSIVLAAFTLLRRAGVARRMLVVAPLRVARAVWPVEAAKWADFADLRVVVVHGKDARERLARLQEDADVYVINPEGLVWLEGLSRRAWKFWPEMLVVDESTRLKHTRRKRFSALRKLLPRFRRRYVLTGTPAPNGLLDLFGQVLLLDCGKTFGPYITSFRREFFTPTGFKGYRWVPQPDAEERIFRKLRPLVMRLSADDYLDLPKLVETDVRVDLSAEARRTYDRFAEDLVVHLREGRVTAANGGAATSKLRQLAGGNVYLDGSEEWARGRRRKARAEVVHTAKLDALEELVGELNGQPALVAFEFRHERDAIRARLGKDLPSIDGETSPAATVEAIEAWNHDALPVLLVQPQAAAFGLNLQAGGHGVVFYALGWNLEYHDQLVRRLYRMGRQRPVFVYRLIAAGTIDRTVARVLAGKDHTQRRLLHALREDLDAC